MDFMDLTKAFDTVPRQKLYRKLWKVGVQGKMYGVIKDLYTDNIARITVGDYESQSLKNQE